MIRAMMLGTVLILTGCVAAGVPKPVADKLQAEINSENQFCDQQFYKEKMVEKPSRYYRWAQCRAERTQPLEKKLFPHLTQKVTAKYHALVSGMEAVERHETTVAKVMEDVDRLNDTYNRTGCPVEYFGADAHPQCDSL